jgi:hypothetical protein
MFALESWRHLAHEAVHFLRDLFTGDGLALDEMLRIVARSDRSS